MILFASRLIRSYLSINTLNNRRLRLTRPSLLDFVEPPEFPLLCSRSGVHACIPNGPPTAGTSGCFLCEPQGYRVQISYLGHTQGWILRTCEKKRKYYWIWRRECYEQWTTQKLKAGADNILRDEFRLFIQQISNIITSLPQKNSWKHLPVHHRF